MVPRTLLICPGATKAGTTWLYRYLHDHPSCHVRAVKELHYFTTFDAEERAKKSEMLSRSAVRYEGERSAAADAGVGWKAANMARRVKDTSDLHTVLTGDRGDDAAYARYLLDGISDDAQVCVDVTPGYAVLDRSYVERMAKLPFSVKVLFMVRDPLERLWSHIRMHANRYLRDGQEVVSKAGNVLWRVLNEGHESHITERGDYKATIQTYASVFGQDQMKVAFSENLSSESGQKDICQFLNIPHVAPQKAERGHVGSDIPFPEKKRRKTVKFLWDQYQFMSDEFGPLPPNWTRNMEVYA